ncbi:ABC transporter ATP-binding protein [candidate division KSB1 bacterium]|nr:ABC transporter ATP-binding protein [candidate division KSB1 bacterium]
MTVERGDVFGFLGPNGAGKSTTIRMIVGLIRPTEGHIKIFGQSLKAQRVNILSRIGALVEKPSFYRYLPAWTNLYIHAKMLGGNAVDTIDDVLKLVDLSDRASSKVKTYSQGMKQRLGIAQALLGKPEFIILDEPTTGLDPQGMIDIRLLIKRLSSEGITVMLSSHLLHEVEQICNRMAIINHGKLIVQGDVRTLLSQRDGTLHVIVDKKNVAKQALSALPWLQSVAEEANGLRISLPHQYIPDMNAALVNAGVRVSAIHSDVSLEDYFLSMVETTHGNTDLSGMH